jgi:hypothetical protein
LRPARQAQTPRLELRIRPQKKICKISSEAASQGMQKMKPRESTPDDSQSGPPFCRRAVARSGGCGGEKARFALKRGFKFPISAHGRGVADVNVERTSCRFSNFLKALRDLERRRGRRPRDMAWIVYRQCVRSFAYTVRTSLAGRYGAMRLWDRRRR